MGILSYPSAIRLPHQYHPSKVVASKLWNVFLNRVEGCLVLKVTHIPTDQIRIYSTIADPAKASLEDLAFSLSVYFAAIVSLDEDESYSILSEVSIIHLLELKTGIEQTFAYANILENPTLTLLRAMAIYLASPSDPLQSFR